MQRNWILLLFCVLALACGRSSDGTAPAAALDEDVVEGILVVDFTDGITKAQYDAIETGWGIDVEFNSVLGSSTGITLTRSTLPADLTALLDTIRSHPEVEAVEPLYEYEMLWVPNDPRYDEQWNLEQIHMPEAWERATGKGVTVAVIDTGVAYHDHDDFKVVPDLADAKFVDGYDFVHDNDHPHDDNGHGTHVAGTIAQVTDNGEGVAGIAFDARIMPIKVLSRFGGGNSADIAEAIRWAADHDADVINLSLGGGARSRVMERAVRYAVKKDVVVVAAAGNAARGRVEFPAAYDGVIAVSAVGPDGKLAPYSSWGEQITVSAPGGDKESDETGGVLQNTIVRGQPGESEYAWYQGTSMATPHVAGVAALLKSVGVDEPAMVERIISKSAADQGEPGWDVRYGYGLLDANEALNLAGSSFKETTTIPRSVITALIAALLAWIFRRRKGSQAVNILTPSFVVGTVLAAVGFFFLRWLGVGGIVDMASYPVAEWERWGLRAALPSPLAYSALIPVVAGVLSMPARRGRLFVAGLGVGFAGFLLWALVSGAEVAWIGSGLTTQLWLGVNALVALITSWSLLRVAYGGRRG